MATEDLSTVAGWEAFKARHQGEIGTGQLSANTDQAGHRLPPDQVFWKYTMKDGTTIEINQQGDVKSIDEKGPSVATGTSQPTETRTAPTTKQYTVTNPDESTDTYQYIWDPQSNQFKLDTTYPTEHKPPPAGAAANRAPTDPSKWVQIHSDPSDPSSPVIALQDPQNSSNRISVPAATKSDRPSIVQGPQGSIYSWDGTSLNQLMPGTPDKRQIVQGQNGRLLAWDGQNLSVLDPGSQPKQGDTRQAIQNGRQTTQTYSGGDWVTTSIGPSAIPGQPQEGDTRQAIQNGYNTTQTYSGGDWVTTGMGTKATPAQVQQVSAAATEPYLTTYNPDTGQYTQTLNAGYIPKTQADVAARVGQLQQAAQQQRDQLAQQVTSGRLSQDQAAQQFDQWWSQNVESQKAALDAAQREATITQQQTQAEQQRASYATAMSAGQNAVDAQKALMPYAVGPGWGDLLGKMANAVANPGSNPGAGLGVSPQEVARGVMFTPPDFNQISQQATAQALAHLSPTAASIVGNNGVPSAIQQAQGADISQLLNRNAPQYQFGAGAPAPPGAPPPGAPPPTLPGAAPTLPTGTGFSTYPNAVNPALMPGYAALPYQPSF